MFATYYKLTRKNYSRSSLLLFLDKVKPVSCLFFGCSEAGELNVLRRSFRQRPLNFFVSARRGDQRQARGSFCMSAHGPTKVGDAESHGGQNNNRENL